MKRLILALSVLLASASAAAAQQTPAGVGLSGPPVVTFVEAGRLLADPSNGVVQRSKTLVISGNQVVDIRDGFVGDPAQGRVIDLRDSFVLPGLIDSHVHLTGQQNPNSRLEEVTQSEAAQAMVGARYARRTLMAGFTTVQDVGGNMEAVRALRAGVEAGEFPGPRMRIAGGAVTPTGGHADINGWSVEVMRANGSPYACNGADDCARAVRQLVQEGADVIKITATGGVLSSTGAGVEQQFFQEELDAIVGAAHMMGRKVTAHAHGVTGINAFLRAGGDSIEHGTYLDRESIRLFRDNDAVLVPTVMAGEWVANQADAGWMTPFQAAKARVVGPLMLEMVRRAHEGGVTIAFGTDSGVSAHGDNAREFLLYTMAGMTEMEALATATTVGARHVQLEDEIGRIAPGFSADIVATNGDPLENIEELMDIDFVMARGVVHKNEE